MNEKNILDAFEAVDDKFILEAKEHKSMKKKTHWGRRIAISVAAVLVLFVATIGTAMAVSEDFRIVMYRNYYRSVLSDSIGADLMERARINDFPNRVKLWLYDELKDQGVWGTDLEAGTEDFLVVEPLEWSDLEGVYVGQVTVKHSSIASNGTYTFEYANSEIYVVRHTWHGFEITNKFALEKPTDDKPITIGMVSNKDFTLVCGWFGEDQRIYNTYTDRYGREGSYYKFNIIQLSDGSELEMGLQWFGPDDYGSQFASIAWGDHRGATVADLAEILNWGEVIFDGHVITEEELAERPWLRREVVTTYTEEFGEPLPVVVVE